MEHSNKKEFLALIDLLVKHNFVETSLRCNNRLDPTFDGPDFLHLGITFILCLYSYRTRVCSEHECHEASTVHAFGLCKSAVYCLRQELSSWFLPRRHFLPYTPSLLPLLRPPPSGIVGKATNMPKAKTTCVCVYGDHWCMEDLLLP